MSRGPAWFRQKAGRRDANHKAIVAGLEKLGHFVVDTASCGNGTPDMLVYRRIHDDEYMSRLTRPVWLELKVGKGKLRASQVAWRASAEARGVRVATVRTLDEALEALR